MIKIERNNKCYCGSNKKYKKCCMDKDKILERESANISLAKIFKEASVKECLYVDKTNCSEKIIRAHSIQENRILNKISENGEVLMRSYDATEKDFNLVMKLVGKGKATSFTGFCGYHDKIVFQPIEDFDYIPDNLEQNALFAFRAFAKEWHAKLVAKKLHESIIEKYPNSSTSRYSLIGTEMALNDIQKHVDVFKVILLEKKYELLKTLHVCFNDEFLLAVSAGVTIPYDFKGNRLEHLATTPDVDSRFLFITVFPQNGKTHILLSYLSKDEEFYAFLKTQLLDVDLDVQKTRISNLIMINCENLALSPSCWNKLDKVKQNMFLDMTCNNLSQVESPKTLGSNFGFTLFI